MKVFAYPLIPFTISLSLGIVFNYFLKLNFLVLLIFLLFFLVTLGLFWIKEKRSWKPTINFGIITYIIAFNIGTIIQHLNYNPNSDYHYSKRINSSNSQSVKGTILSNLKSTAKNTKHLVAITEVNSEKVNGKILIYVRKNNQKGMVPGDEIAFISEFQNIPNNFNPYQFDYAAYLKNQNIFHQVFLNNNDFIVLSHHENWNSFWYSVQNKLIDSYAIHHFDSKTNAILNSLLFGQRKLLDQETLATYSNAGIIHILAISGLHVGIIYLLLLTLFKPFHRIKNGKLLALILTLVFLWSFAIITGLSASVTRSVTMFSVIAIGNYLNRNSNIYNTIAFSALLLLLFNPNFIFDVGFQMSYAAVLAIVSLNPIFHYFHFSNSKIIKFFIDLSLVSIAAQIGVLPLSLYYFNQFPILFLIANIVVIPLTILILWIGITTLILNALLPKLSILVGKILEFLISILNNYAEWISKFELFIIRNISFNEILCLLSYFIIISFIFWTHKRTFKNFKTVLLGVIFLQVGFLFTKQGSTFKNEFIVYNSQKPIISMKHNNSVSFYTNNIEFNSNTINHYKRGSFVEDYNISTLENIYTFKNNRILIIDSVYYPIIEKPTHLIITNNPKINFDRVLKETKPKQVIVDNSNPFYKVEQWKTTCEKRKIPFHATAEKGFYKLK